MRIGIIGAGHIGGTLARLLVRAGHHVAISNSRGPATLAAFVADLGGRAEAATVADAMRFGEMLIVSIPFGRYRELPTDGVAGKVVIDTCNYYPQRDGAVAELDAGRTTSSEMIQAHLPGARVVKALNTVPARELAEGGKPAGTPGRRAVPISGDDPTAKEDVAALIDTLGFDAVDAGTLAEGGRKHQPGTAVYGADLTAAEVQAELV